VKKDEYFTFNHNVEDGNLILSNIISEPAAYLVFSVLKPLSDIITKYYPEVYPFHHIKPLLNHICRNRKRIHGNYTHLHIERDYFNLIIFDHKTMNFCNTFNYRNKTDIIYYVLNVFKNLGIKQEETLYLSGLTKKNDALLSDFSAYVRNIKFAQPSGSFSFSYVFNELDLHRYINLFSLVN
jgi:hypothetical protein